MGTSCGRLRLVLMPGDPFSLLGIFNHTQNVFRQTYSMVRVRSPRRRRFFPRGPPYFKLFVVTMYRKELPQTL
jgi:hypothetical protein